MHIELNDDQARALIEMLLFDLEATKALLSMEEDHSQRIEEAMGNKLDEIVALKAEIKALKSAQTAKPAKALKESKKVVAETPAKRGRPKKVA
jgi:hypothetical protein